LYTFHCSLLEQVIAKLVGGIQVSLAILARVADCPGVA